MKKRIARVAVYTGLLGLSVLVLSHPYIWQSIFGPTIKGEPFWAWQQEFRARAGSQPDNNTLSAKILNILHIDNRPLQWTGSFPANDAELLAVVLSLADDPDHRVRWAVVFYLEPLLREPRVFEVVLRLLDDSHSDVRHWVIVALRSSGPNGKSAIPKLREMLSDATPETRIFAAMVAIELGDQSAGARNVLYDGANSSAWTVRSIVWWGLSPALKDDERLFGILAGQLKKTTWSTEQRGLIASLATFGKKATPAILRHLNDRDPAVVDQAILALGKIGPDAREAVPALEELSRSNDEGRRRLAREALVSIDPNWTAKE